MEPPIALNINVSPQQEAAAGNSAMIFTASDRKIIEERAGEIDKSRSFREIFTENKLLPVVDKEATTIQPKQETIGELEGRYREHKKMLKNSPRRITRDHVDISDGTVEPAPVTLSSLVAISQPEQIIEEKNPAQPKIDTASISDKFTLQEDDLHNLICRIKSLHLQRLFCSGQKEFEDLTLSIKKDTLAAGRPEAKEWIEAQLNTLTLIAAEYKLKLLKSLKIMHFDETQMKNIQWLESVIKKSS